MPDQRFAVVGNCDQAHLESLAQALRDWSQAVGADVTIVFPDLNEGDGEALLGHLDLEGLAVTFDGPANEWGNPSPHAGVGAIMALFLLEFLPYV
jgi:hypothetical protein